MWLALVLAAAPSVSAPQRFEAPPDQPSSDSEELHPTVAWASDGLSAFAVNADDGAGLGFDLLGRNLFLDGGVSVFSQPATGIERRPVLLTLGDGGLVLAYEERDLMGRQTLVVGLVDQAARQLVGATRLPGASAPSLALDLSGSVVLGYARNQTTPCFRTLGTDAGWCAPALNELIEKTAVAAGTFEAVLVETRAPHVRLMLDGNEYGLNLSSTREWSPSLLDAADGLRVAFAQDDVVAATNVHLLRLRRSPMTVEISDFPTASLVSLVSSSTGPLAVLARPGFLSIENSFGLQRDSLGVGLAVVEDLVGASFGDATLLGWTTRARSTGSDVHFAFVDNGSSLTWALPAQATQHDLHVVTSGDDGLVVWRQGRKQTRCAFFHVDAAGLVAAMNVVACDGPTSLDVVDAVDAVVKDPLTIFVVRAGVALGASTMSIDGYRLSDGAFVGSQPAPANMPPRIELLRAGFAAGDFHIAYASDQEVGWVTGGVARAVSTVGARWLDLTCGATCLLSWATTSIDDRHLVDLGGLESKMGNSSDVPAPVALATGGATLAYAAGSMVPDGLTFTEYVIGAALNAQDNGSTRVFTGLFGQRVDSLRASSGTNRLLAIGTMEPEGSVWLAPIGEPSQLAALDTGRGVGLAVTLPGHGILVYEHPTALGREARFVTWAELDGGASDGGQGDAGPVDAGAFDAGLFDGGAGDAGSDPAEEPTDAGWRPTRFETTGPSCDCSTVNPAVLGWCVVWALRRRARSASRGV